MVDEVLSLAVLEVEVSRHHMFQTDGTSGPIHSSARVNYYLRPITASPDLDYTQSNGTLVFAPGSTEEMIHIEILPDDIPEISESFLIVLEILDGDIVLMDPSVVQVTITDNDDPNGVFSFKANSSSVDPVTGALHLDEDSGSLSVSIEVMRHGGHFGEVTLDWRLTKSSGEVPEDVRVSPREGRLVFGDMEVEHTIVLRIEENNKPEVAEKYLLSLLQHTLQGKYLSFCITIHI